VLISIKKTLLVNGGLCGEGEDSISGLRGVTE